MSRTRKCNCCPNTGAESEVLFIDWECTAPSCWYSERQRKALGGAEGPLATHFHGIFLCSECRQLRMFPVV